MILSHRHRFIFIKTNKTAGTSVEIALSKFCGEQDIITPISPEDQDIRRQLGFPGPQNYLAPFSWRDCFNVRRRLRGGRALRKYYNHMPASEIRSHVGEDVWQSYYKFCIERNPYDRVISLYFWQNRSQNLPDLSTFIQSGAPQVLKEKGENLYLLDGKVAVEKICRFESLEQDLEEVRLHLGLPEPLELPRAKSSQRKDRRPYRELLTAADRAALERTFESEIRRLGYSF